MYICNYTMVLLFPSELLKHLELGTTVDFFTAAGEERVSERESEQGKAQTKRKHRNELVKIQQRRLSILVCKHVRYVCWRRTQKMIPGVPLLVQNTAVDQPASFSIRQYQLQKLVPSVLLSNLVQSARASRRMHICKILNPITRINVN